MLGAGWFNFAEGIINHHLLQIHHVNPVSPNRLFFDLDYVDRMADLSERQTKLKKKIGLSAQLT
ncbi:DUF2243 domain-containing protein [Bacillus swezeyi]|uniref:DUF2243 domain-containing protein n=1 Tax=Bacillus swezeyi TaxID=1925020 RepID=UPI001FD3A8E1|nr:DUF2243 domain-containing protein [Bacillus swezeyi]